MSGAEGNTRCTQKGEGQRDLARSHVKTPCRRGSIMRENRETLLPPIAMVLWDAMGSPRTEAIDARSRESDCCVVPTKLSNKEGKRPTAEPWLT